MAASGVTKVFCGVFASSDGYSYQDWNFYGGTPLSTCRTKKCDGTGELSTKYLLEFISDFFI